MGSIRKKGAGYEARYRDPQGRSRSKTFRVKAEARAFLISEESDKQRGRWIDPRGGRVKLEAWADEVMAGRLDQRPSGKDRDLSHLHNHVLPAFGESRLSSITRKEVRDWVQVLSAKGLAPRTVRDCYRVLGYIMREAVSDKLIVESPCYQVALPRIPERERRYLSHDQVISLARAMDPRYAALVFVGAYMGLRWAEAAGLKHQHLDLLRRRLRVAGTLERVGGSYRYVEETKTLRSKRMLDIPQPLVEILARHLEDAPDSEFVFTAPKGGMLLAQAWRQRFWIPAVEAAGLGPLTFHELRHTCVALLIDEGADILFVQRFLGHKDIGTTANVYGHLFPQRGQDVAQQMGSALSEALSRPTDFPQTGHEQVRKLSNIG